jgi:hypothetical protein
MVSLSETIAIEQLRRPAERSRNTGGVMCSKLVAEIKTAETSPTTF